jgi:hypothetical protein
MSLGDLGGFFSGDPKAMRFSGQVDDVTNQLLAGGQANAAQNAAVNQSTRLGTMLAGQASGNPALAARAGAAAGTNAAIDGQMAAAQMRQSAQLQGAGMAQQRINAERARQGNAMGALLGMAGSVGAMMIPGGQAGGIAGLAGQAINPNARTNTANSPVYAPPDPSAQPTVVPGGVAPNPPLGPQTPQQWAATLAQPAPTPRASVQPFDRPTSPLSTEALGQLEGLVRNAPTQNGAQRQQQATQVQAMQAAAPSAQPAQTTSSIIQSIPGMMNAGGNPLLNGLQQLANPFGDDLLRSDEESKHAIRDASQAIDAFLSSMDGGRQFQYNNPQAPGANPGNQVGVMAQDLERSPMGQQMVQQGPDGQRMINPQTALSGMLAAQARLHQRLEALEGGQHGENMPVRQTPPEAPRQGRTQTVNPPYGMFDTEPARYAGTPAGNFRTHNGDIPIYHEPGGVVTAVGTPQARVVPTPGEGAGFTTQPRGVLDRVANDPMVRRTVRPLDQFLQSPAGMVLQPAQALGRWLGGR